MLQEVHCSEKTNPLWSAEWGYKTIFGAGNASNWGGVAMLFNNSLTFNINKLFSDPNGRYIICDIEIDQKLLL